MRPTRPKQLCKFKDTCKNYVQGKQCPFSHEKCKFGNDCKNMETCMFFHERKDNQSKSNSKFQKQKSEVECKFGARCIKKAQGLCGFKHSQSAIPNNIGPFKSNNIKMGEQRAPKNQTLCRFGQRCTSFPLGKCPYKHQQPFVSSVPSNSFHQEETESILPSRQNHFSIFDNLCLKYLTNNHCDGGCSKAHDFSETKTIGKIFQVSSCERVIKSLMVMQPYQSDEQPLYIILSNNRIAFGQLTNLAKESGNENISNNSLVMKRWFDKDIQFAGDQVLNIRLVKVQIQGQRADILICRCSNTIRIVALNKQRSFNIPINEDFVDAILIKNILIILLKSTKNICFQFNFQRVQFKERPSMINQPLIFLKKYHKLVQGQEIAAGATADGTLCFLNSQLQAFVFKFKNIVKDICFTQYQNLPVALLLTTEGKIEVMSLLTFETSTILDVKLQSPSLSFSSLTLTQQHLFIAIDWFGVLVYNIQKFDKAIGVLGLGDTKWILTNDQRGNVCCMSSSRQGRMNASVFKIRKF